MNKKIILASGSPRRKEILENIGIEFTVVKSVADESSINPEGIPVSVYVQELALLKATEVKSRVSAKNAIVIGADTVVSVDGKILGKPANDEEAYNMLKSLSGKTHQVYTGYCGISTDDGSAVCESICTDVTFAELSDEEIYDYIHTGECNDKADNSIWNTNNIRYEWQDKAGGYAIQGYFARFVKRIDGDYYNVVGLPISRLYQTLKNEFDFKI